MDYPIFHAFTIKFNGRTNVLFTKVKISEAYDPSARSTQTIPQTLECNAIWDTGASASSITQSLAHKLGLKPFTKVPVSNTSGKELKDAYFVNVQLPNNVLITHVRVTECKELIGDSEFLVGMDIIGSGDFAVTHADSKTTMSYRIPSIETVDYVVLADTQNAQRLLEEKLKQKSARRQKLPREALRKKRKRERQNRKKAKKHRKR